jgi:preprotein translocase subunit SecY
VVQQAKHMRGRRVYGGSKQYLPLRVNHAGVMPIIFAQTLVTLPAIGLQKLYESLQGHNSWFSNSVGWLSSTLHYGTYMYFVMYCAMIFFFSYFWNTVQFQQKEMANQLRDYGSFVPGLRPGKRTADYLENVMSRITYVGAAFLCVIAVIPSMISQFMLGKMDSLQASQITQFLGGTGLLIVISVMLDFVNRIEANLVMRNYGGFMEGDSGGSPAKIRRPKGGPARGPTQPEPASYRDGGVKGLPA